MKGLVVEAIEGIKPLPEFMGVRKAVVLKGGGGGGGITPPPVTGIMRV